MKNKSYLSIISIVFIVVTIFGVVSFFVPMLNKENNSSSTSPIMEEINFSTLTYSAIGDSITYGVNPLGGRLDSPYCEVVGDILGLENVTNLGVGGMSIAEVVDRPKFSMVSTYRDVPTDSDIISVMGGINDLRLDVPLGTIDDYVNNTFYGALNIIARDLQVYYKDAFIFFITPLQSGAWDSSGTLLVPYLKAMKEVCKKYDIPLCDTYNTCNFDDYMYDYEDDHTHPDQNFHTNILAPKIAQFIKDNYKK